MVLNVEGHHRGHTMVRPDARDTLSRTDKPVLWTSMHGGHPLAVLGTINIRDCDGGKESPMCHDFHLTNG